MDRILPIRFRSSPRRGFTLTEVMVASALSLLVATGVVSLTITFTRMTKGSMTEQSTLRNAQATVEFINREIHLANGSVRVLDNAGSAVSGLGNTVTFARANEPANSRAFYLVSDDTDITTPQDNRLVFDPNTAVNGDQVTIATGLSPLPGNPVLNPPVAFRCTATTCPLIVQMRIGDPVSATQKVQSGSDAFTGMNAQGVEINIAVAPRNNY